MAEPTDTLTYDPSYTGDSLDQIESFEDFMTRVLTQVDDTDKNGGLKIEWEAERKEFYLTPESKEVLLENEENIALLESMLDKGMRIYREGQEKGNAVFNSNIGCLSSQYYALEDAEEALRNLTHVNARMGQSYGVFSFLDKKDGKTSTVVLLEGLDIHETFLLSKLLVTGFRVCNAKILYD